MASSLALFYLHLLVIILKCVEFPVTVAVGDKWSISTPTGLYVASDKVAILSADNFNTNVYNSSSAWLVQFYNSWCGHCIKFAPVWKQLAADIYNWRNIVKISALDCAEDHNTQHCRDYEIMGYPTVRYFAPFTTKFTIGNDFPRQKDDAEYLRNKIVAQLEMTQKSSSPMSNWPDLAPVENTDSLGWPISTIDAEIMLLVVENDTSFAGRDLIMDLHGISGLNVRRLVRPARDTLEIRVRSKNGTLDGSIIPVASGDRRTIYNSVSEYLRRVCRLDVPNLFANNQTGNGDGQQRTVKVKQSLKQQLLVHTVFQADLDTALSYSLFHEIPLQSHIEGEKMSALVAYLRILNKYFPTDEDKMRNFLSNLAEDVAAYKKLTGAKFRELLYKHDGQFLEKRKQWIGCKGSTAIYRGYPCGLWMLFHTLTAHKYIAASPANDDPAEVPNAMVGYIRYFFGCADCAKHFLEMSETIAGNVTTSAEAVLWLWRAHNTVNRRLAGDTSEDPAFPKVQFPLPEMCPQCRYPDSSGWNETNVLSYLVTMYTNVHRIYENAAFHRLQSGDDEQTETKSWFKYGFFKDNPSVILYVLCVCTLTICAVKIFLKRNSSAQERAKCDVSYKA